MTEKKTAFNKAIQETIHPAFRFVVEIGGDKQGIFTECTLPVIEWEIEEVKEGGLNAYTHQLPGRRKGARLTLKNGVGKVALIDWYLATLDRDGGQFEYKDITVTLLDAANKEAVMTWKIEKAFPIKWTGPQLKTSDNSIAIQTLEFACGYIGIS